VRSGNPISTALWQTVGIKTVADLSAAFPQVVPFILRSTMLPPPADSDVQPQYSLLALLHCPGDPYVNNETNVDVLALTDRKVALRSLHIVVTDGCRRLDLYRHWSGESARDMVIWSSSFSGRVLVLLPPDLGVTSVVGLREKERESFVDRWMETQTSTLRNFINHGRFDHRACQQMILDIRLAKEGRILEAESKERLFGVLGRLRLAPGRRYPIFLYFEQTAPHVGVSKTVSIAIKDAKTDAVEGGSAFDIALAREPVVKCSQPD
jgi:hypothetical protein